MATKGYRYNRLGPIASVLTLESFAPPPGEVTVTVKKAPLHRADAAVISGTTRSGAAGKGPFPRLGGSEAVGVVAESVTPKIPVGATVWVAPPFGGWAQTISVPAVSCHVVDPKHVALAPLASSLLTANRLLKFAKLKPGSVVVQNGGSSVVALAVSALAQTQNIKVISAAAPGPRFAAAAARQKIYGSELVEYNPAGARKARALAGSKGSELFLNGVGGPMFNEFLKLLGQNGTAVTYGAQHGFGIMWAGGPQILKTVTLSGFSLPRAFAKITYEQRQAELDEVLATFTKLNFQYPIKECSLEQLPSAWDEAYVAGGQKAILSFA